MDEEKEEQLRLKSVYGIGPSLVVFIVAGLIFLFLSPIYHVVAYDIYIKSMSVGDVRYVLMALSGLLLLLFHSVDGYSWPSTPRLLGVLFVLYMFLAAVLSTAELYPGAVLITALAQFPILLGACGEVTSLSTRDFHRIVSVSCFLAGVLVMGLWVGWIYAVDMQWNDQTKAKLRGEWMVDVYRVMRVSDWSLCETVRSMKSISPASIDESGIDMLAKCSKIELTYFLIWTCPLFVCGALMVMAFFSALHWKVVATGRTGPEKFLKLVVLVFLSAATVFWVLCNTAGASMGLSNLFFGIFLGASCVMAVWLVQTMNYLMQQKTSRRSLVWQCVMPFLQSEWSAAFLLCCAGFLLPAFLLLEFIIQRVRPMGDDRSAWLTPRGAIVWDMIREKHWLSVLEKAFALTIGYLVFYLFSKVTPLFLAVLADWLPSNLIAVMVVFYIVGLIMFLLPPVPGVPVYMAAGFIVMESSGPELSFLVGFLMTSVMCLLLKLTAVAIQQKLIGQCLGGSLYIQQLVGVHTVNVRAIEKILKQPGLGVQKVLILCGGPDWPTSVLTGILRLPVGQMLIGTLPCFILLMPAVLAGASLTEPDASKFSTILVMIVGMTQGGAMLLAFVFIAREIERSHDELIALRPEHDALLERVNVENWRTMEYKRCTRWFCISWFNKLLLMLGVALELGVCLAFALVGSSCFKPFEIGNRIDADVMDGGLDGNVMNIIECPFGAGLLYAMIAGIFMYGLYTWLTRRHILRKQAFEARCASVTWSGAKMEVDDACRFSLPSIESFMSQR